MHKTLPTADEMPWTIAFVLRKRAQIDSLAELPKEKRPPDKILWYGTPEEMDDWFDKVFGKKKNKNLDEFELFIDDNDIED